MTQIQKIELRDLIRNDMTRETKGEAKIYDQSGYDWSSNKVDFYFSPSEYNELVCNMNSLSN